MNRVSLCRGPVCWRGCRSSGRGGFLARDASFGAADGFVELEGLGLRVRLATVVLAAVVGVVVDAVPEKVTALGVRGLDRVMAAEDRLPLLGVTLIQSESSAGGML